MSLWAKLTKAAGETLPLLHPDWTLMLDTFQQVQDLSVNSTLTAINGKTGQRIQVPITLKESECPFDKDFHGVLAYARQEIRKAADQICEKAGLPTASGAVQ